MLLCQTPCSGVSWEAPQALRSARGGFQHRPAAAFGGFGKGRRPREVEAAARRARCFAEVLSGPRQPDPPPQKEPPARKNNSEKTPM